MYQFCSADSHRRYFAREDANTLLHLEVNTGLNPASVHASGTIGHVTVEDL